jgi:hypothetical protein
VSAITDAFLAANPDVDPRLISYASAVLLACALRHQIVLNTSQGRKTVTYHPLYRLTPLYL